MKHFLEQIYGVLFQYTQLFPFLFTFIVCFHHGTFIPKSKELKPDVKKIIVVLDLSTKGFFRGKNRWTTEH